ncbi:MAG: GAF domain-containing protein, partial [Chloroflexi bacterium]|nr:GAF domain-containing protein [Chloroflexota bacterium]
MIGTRDRVPTDKSISVNADLEAHRQAAVASLGEFALRGASQDRLISHAVAACADLLPADFVKVLELLPGGRELLLRAGKGWNEGVVGLATVPNDAGSQAGFTLLEDEPVLVHDLELETRFTAPQLLTDHAVRSGISVVIRENGRPFGVLAVHSQIPGAFQESDAQFMRSLANVMGSAFQQRKSEDELRALAEISRVITSSTDIREVYAQFAALANELVPFDRLVIAIYDAEAETLTDQYAAGVEVAGWSEGNTHPLRGTALEAVVRERIPFIATGLDDSEPMEHPARPASAKVGLPAMLAVPLVSRDRVIGTLNLKAATPGAYIDADAALARQVADQIAGAIAASETSKRYRDLYDNAPDMYFSVDGASGRITRCNKTALDALGYSREEIIGMPVVDLYHPSSQDHYQQLITQFKQTGEIRGAELKVVRKD